MRVLLVAMLLVSVPALAEKDDMSGLQPMSKRQLQSFKAWISDCPAKSDSLPRDCPRMLPKQKQRLDKVDPKDLNHPVVRKYTAMYAAMEKNYNHWKAVEDGKANQRRATQALQRNFTADVEKKHYDAIYKLTQLKNGESIINHSHFPGAVEKFYEKSEALQSLAKDCDGKYASLKDSLSTVRRWKWTKGEVCATAKEWKVHMKTFAQKSVKKHNDYILEIDKKSNKKMLKDGMTHDGHIADLKGIGKRAEKDRGSFSAIFKKLGATLPASTFNSWVEEGAHGLKIFAAAKKKRRKLPVGKKSSVSSALKKAIKGSGFKFVKYGLRSSQADIEKNGLGIPLYKRWVADVLLKKKGENYCRVYTFGVTADYKGGGRYQRPATTFTPDKSADYRVGSCR